MPGKCFVVVVVLMTTKQKIRTVGSWREDGSFSAARGMLGGDYLLLETFGYILWDMKCLCVCVFCVSVHMCHSVAPTSKLHTPFLALFVSGAFITI